MMGLAIAGSGMVTGVGYDTAAACAAFRAGLDGFQAVPFFFAGDPLIGCPVPLLAKWQGRDRLIRMAERAIRECLGAKGSWEGQAPDVLLCISEFDRPGRPAGLGASMLSEISQRLGLPFGPNSNIFAAGRFAGAEALQAATRVIGAGGDIIIVGVDSFLETDCLTAFDRRRRLATADRSNGFIPGEAAAAVWIQSPQNVGGDFVYCVGLGFGEEPAPIESDLPLRADGLRQAIQSACQSAGIAIEDIDYRISDSNGEPYGFKETSLALMRVLRQRKDAFELWMPAESFGEVGAASVPCMLAIALQAVRKGYAPGANVLCQVTSDGGKRAAVILKQNTV